MTFCARCGGDADELMLIGNLTVIRECASCDRKLYGMRSTDKCACGSYGPHREVGRVGERDKLPAVELCKKCQQEIAEHEAIVTSGGVYWRCLECKCEGVIKPNDFTKAVRKTMKEQGTLEDEEHGPCGVEFKKCEEHKTE
jgi:hypothetical protein